MACHHPPTLFSSIWESCVLNVPTFRMTAVHMVLYFQSTFTYMTLSKPFSSLVHFAEHPPLLMKRSMRSGIWSPLDGLVLSQHQQTAGAQ